MTRNVFMKVSIALLSCFFLTSCYFGANESGGEIVNNVYSARWDDDSWISYSKNGDGIWDSENIIVSHHVFAIGDYDDFIIAKQHPCKNKQPHTTDFDDLKPDRDITIYIIIDTRNDSYVVHRYQNENDFNEAKTQFGIPVNLTYKFYAKEID
ncbi:DUF3997 domain-containing protein [Saonia flava]|nr:DUF3997 domain-containing protein [Saonia flava]